MTPVQLEILTTTETCQLEIRRNQWVERIRFLSFFEYAWRCSGCLVVHQFGIGMLFDDICSVLCNHNDPWQTATGSQALLWLHWGDCGAAWFRLESLKTDSPYVQMKEEYQYDLRLFARRGRFLRDICVGNFWHVHMTPDVSYVCIDFLYSDSWFLRFRSHLYGSLDFEHQF